MYPSDDPSLSAHHGNVTQMDDAFGQLIAALDKSGQRANTFVRFASDTGPAITSMHPHGSAGPLRDKKGAMYEGGIRVPGIAQWPGRIKPGTHSDEPVCGVDLLATLCEIAGVKPPTDRTLDGVSIVPVLHGEKLNRTKPLYWQFNRAHSAPKVAIRFGDWKLLARLTTPDLKPSADITDEEIEATKSAQLTGFELYNLASDIGETQDLQSQNKAEFESLKGHMIAMFTEIQAEAPRWPAWEWPRYESQRIEWPDYWLKKKQGQK